MKTLLSLALVLTSMVFVHADWTTNYKAALTDAKAQNKLVLLDFTGSDWCPPCKLLHEEVFTQKAFKDFADKRYILVTVDFPQGKQLPDDVKKQNAALATQFNIVGPPTLIVLDADGKELGRQLGYRAGSGPDAVIAQLKSIK